MLVRIIIVGLVVTKVAREVVLVIAGEHQERHHELALIAGALHRQRLVASHLQRRQQNRHQKRDDPDHHQQFDQGKASARTHSGHLSV